MRHHLFMMLWRVECLRIIMQSIVSTLVHSSSTRDALSRSARTLSVKDLIPMITVYYAFPVLSRSRDDKSGFVADFNESKCMNAFFEANFSRPRSGLGGSPFLGRGGVCPVGGLNKGQLGTTLEAPANSSDDPEPGSSTTPTTLSSRPVADSCEDFDRDRLST